jgi:hypothetical protein
VSNQARPSAPWKLPKDWWARRQAFLHHVLGVVVDARQPAREVMGRVEVRYNRPLKPCEFLVPSQIPAIW